MNNTSKFKISPFDGVISLKDFVSSTALYLDGNAKRRARVLLLHSTKDFPKLIDKFRGIRVKCLNQKEGLYLCSRQINELDQPNNLLEVTWLLVDADCSGVYIAISFNNGNHFDKHIHAPLKAFYPYVSSVYLNSKNILSIFKKTILNIDGLDVRVNKMNLRKRIDSIGAKKKIASSLEWSDVSFDELVSRLYEENAWINSLQITMSLNLDDEITRSKFSIHRDGKFICSQNFKLFFFTICNEAIKMSIKSKKLLDKRGRQDNLHLEVKPLIVKFNEAVFSSKDELARFRNVLGMLTMSGLSAHHSNPYYRASLIDYKDGSCYQVWVLSDDSVVISPKMRATVASLKRVYSHINDNFKEGSLRDFYE